MCYNKFKIIIHAPRKTPLGAYFVPKRQQANHAYMLKTRRSPTELSQTTYHITAAKGLLLGEGHIKREMTQARRSRTYSRCKHPASCIREKSTKGGKGRGEGEREGENVGERGANTMFALLPQKRDTMSRNRGQHGKSSIFVGFSSSPLSPKGSPLVPRVTTREIKNNK